MPTRRDFLLTAAAATCASRLPARAQSPLQTKLAADPLRPQFHLLPAKNWMNDPNGPIFFNGQYHMFFQYNPSAAVWGNMSWNHAISPDMLHWQHLPLAFTPTPDSPDSFGCFSGSALRLGSRVYQVYTGTRKSDDAHATIRDGANNIQESQCLAYSDDSRLLRWHKLPQPIIPTPPPGLAITGFRDPSIFQHDGTFYMTVGAGESRIGGCVLLYKSLATQDAPDDLTQWQYLHKLTSGAWNNHPTPNPCDDGEMWECPDFFPLGEGRAKQHVLIYSTLDKVFWQTGDFDPIGLKFNPRRSGLLDLGNVFYAPKTQLDAHGNRILWGWLRERRSDAEMTAAGWSGMMSLPRVLTLNADGDLCMEFLPTLATLRIPSSTPDSLSNAGGELLLTAPSHAPCTLSVRSNATPILTVTRNATGLTVNGISVPLAPSGPLKLHAFFDGSVVEVLLNGRHSLTHRFYVEGPAPTLTMSLDTPQPRATKLQLWDITPISPNRLTTPA